MWLPQLVIICFMNTFFTLGQQAQTEDEKVKALALIGLYESTFT